MKIDAEKPSQEALLLFVICSNLLRVASDNGSAVVVGRSQALKLANELRYFYDTGKLPK